MNPRPASVGRSLRDRQRSFGEILPYDFDTETVANAVAVVAGGSGGLRSAGVVPFNGERIDIYSAIFTGDFDGDMKPDLTIDAGFDELSPDENGIHVITGIADLLGFEATLTSPNCTASTPTTRPSRAAGRTSARSAA